MFKNIRGFNENGKHLPYVDERFQYFQHYWSIVKAEDRDIFFDETWFESHRSVITKIEYQFEHNFEDSYKWFDMLFLSHPYFQRSNIIAKERSVQTNKTKIQKYIDPTGTESEKQKKKNYKIHKNNIWSCINRIKKKIFEKSDYSRTLAKHLTQILSENSPLTDKVKFDIRFLVVAFIMELSAYGYDLKKYIEKIPDIILSTDPLNEFPYEKTLDDFRMDEEKYADYKEEEKNDRSLEKCLSGIVNLINYPLKDGYYVFKVENINLVHPHPIIIGEVTFYNPKISSMLNLSNVKEDNKKRYIEAELFYSPLPDEKFDESKQSTCNAIVKTKIRSHKNIESPAELFQSFQTVMRSLEILNDVIFLSGSKGAVRFFRHIKLHGSYKIASFSFSIFHDAPRKVNVDDIDKFEEVKSHFEFINRINKNTNIGSKLLYIISIHSKLQNNEEVFNFKDLWIAWEALLTRQEMKDFSKIIFQIRYKKHYLLWVFNYLNIKLGTHNMFHSPHFWTLSQEELESLGLSYNLSEKRLKQNFLLKYPLITSAVPIDIVRDIVKRVDCYLANRSGFLKNVDKWVEDTIDEIYIERNMEVHNNLKNNLSAVKLKQDFLRISNALYYELIEFTDGRNANSLKLIMNRLNDYNNKL